MRASLLLSLSLAVYRSARGTQLAAVVAHRRRQRRQRHRRQAVSLCTHNTHECLPRERARRSSHRLPCVREQMQASCSQTHSCPSTHTPCGCGTRVLLQALLSRLSSITLSSLARERDVLRLRLYSRFRTYFSLSLPLSLLLSVLLLTPSLLQDRKTCVCVVSVSCVVCPLASRE